MKIRQRRRWPVRESSRCADVIFWCAYNQRTDHSYRLVRHWALGAAMSGWYPGVLAWKLIVNQRYRCEMLWCIIHIGMPDYDYVLVFVLTRVQVWLIGSQWLFTCWTLRKRPRNTGVSSGFRPVTVTASTQWYHKHRVKNHVDLSWHAHNTWTKIHYRTTRAITLIAALDAANDYRNTYTAREYSWLRLELTKLL